MKRFQFRLDGVLRVRRIAEDRSKRVLDGHRRRIVEIDEELAALASHRAAEQARVRSEREGVLDPEQLRAGQRHINGLGLRAARKAEERLQVQREMAGAQRAVAVARQQREVVERLKERHHDEYLLEVRREEQSEMDEVARQLHATSREDGVR